MSIIIPLDLLIQIAAKHRVDSKPSFVISPLITLIRHDSVLVVS